MVNNAKNKDKRFNCKHNETKTRQILAIVNELKIKQNDVEFNFNLWAAGLDTKIKILMSDKNKMGAESKHRRAS